MVVTRLKIFPFKTKFCLIKCPFKTCITVLNFIHKYRNIIIQITFIFYAASLEIKSLLKITVYWDMALCSLVEHMIDLEIILQHPVALCILN
jgi:hypothetical protein